jgi:hypothetical protein
MLLFAETRLGSRKAVGWDEREKVSSSPTPSPAAAYLDLALFLCRRDAEGCCLDRLPPSVRLRLLAPPSVSAVVAEGASLLGLPVAPVRVLDFT